MFLNRAILTGLSLLLLVHTQTIYSEKTANSIEIELYQREGIIPHLPMLNMWADREFAHYPYLLSSPKEQIVCPSDLILVNATDALLALAKQEDRIVGMAAMISFDSPVLQNMYFSKWHLIEKMQLLGIDYSQMLYVAYFLTAPECHNDEKIVHALYDAVVHFAEDKNKSRLCFMEDISQFDHPLKPSTKTYIEPWEDVICGFTSLNIQIGITWPTVDIHGDVQDIEHTLEFFVKDL